LKVAILVKDIFFADFLHILVELILPKKLIKSLRCIIYQWSLFIVVSLLWCISLHEISMLCI